MLDDGVKSSWRDLRVVDLAHSWPRRWPRRDRLSLVPVARFPVLAAVSGALAVGCGEDEPPTVRYTPEPGHLAAVQRDPYRLTCGDIARQSTSSTSQRMVIHVEFALAREPVLAKRVAAMTGNRVGRSIYWAMTEVCKGREASFEPGRDAVEAVRQGKYLVQPRPEAWNQPSP
jgi:hypothetical protein